MTAREEPATGAARLLSVRVQGFKSFAEKTQVTFGPGISAVVGPNGSGKSNLADALRWALGEQGRALRSRRSEDVIWAGSERRAAVGMADVQLTLDNGDGLLPVDFEVVELGRRLYRSGENDYLLNRQRVRLKDLLDLLDAAHLAENAFLFIGQGMVDQALALRPEERRPLFEEVAGVRRHDRRRRRAEEQLAESEANLARTEDILGELRPQARRLAAQAEQVASRRSAADELAAGLLAAAHARWHAAAARLRSAGDRADELRTAVDAALAALTAAEEEAATVARGLASRAAVEADRRTELDRARAALTGLQLRDGRLDSELGATSRERARLAAERAAAEADLAAQRHLLDEPVEAVDGALAQELGEVSGLLAAALDEVAAARAQSTESAAQAADLERMAAA
ncbi:MAG TPA: AAA family ATPase, partial [Candidatus Eisenbacteria bacterium]|nr:AAA family ATPase [Candidatus Eisenbacteria bacterium]